jgi:hypothetical protein
VFGVRWGVCRPRHRWIGAWCATLLAIMLALAACGTTTSAPPPQAAGTYSNSTYHFRLTYPAGWKLTTLPNGSSAIPLSLEITHSASASTEGAFLSTLTLSVIDTSNPAEATPVAQLQHEIAATPSPLTALTISGHTAYRDAPTQQKSPDGSLTVTHTDYYLLVNRYEYAIATDSVSSDSGAEATLLAMVQGLTLLQP